MLPRSTKTALNILSQNKEGFFIMIEGSQIDWGGHQNNTNYVAEEMLDFDRSIGKALDFAVNNGETLIVVTADHETGGRITSYNVCYTKLLRSVLLNNQCFTRLNLVNIFTFHIHYRLDYRTL